MIATQDDQPVAKVIDFGIAKAIEGEGRDAIATMMTVNDALVGTPAYMPPEQVADQNHKSHVDTRSDIYALGAILYQLLTDQTLIDPFEFREMNWGQRIDTLRNPDVKKPSSCLKTIDEAAGIGENRGTTLKGLVQKLSGDLDLVIMKCLAIDPDERYPSVDQLRADLYAWLSGRPVSVMPPSTIYRLKKYVKRNRGPVFAAAIVFLSLILGSTAALVSRQNALAARELAVEAQGETENALKKADAVQAFLQSIIASPNPYKHGPDVKLVDVLRDAESNIAEDFAGQPEVEARIRYSIGRSYDSLGLHVEAHDQFEKANVFFSSNDHYSNAFLVDFYSTFGKLKSQIDHPDGERVLTKAYELSKQVEEPRLKIKPLRHMANHFLKEKNGLKAVELYGRCIEIARSENLDTTPFELGVATSLHRVGETLKSSQMLKKLVNDRSAIEDGLYLQVLIAYCKVLFELNDLKPLELILQEAKNISYGLYGDGHYYSLFVDHYNALYLARTGESDLAFDIAKSTYERRKKLYGPDNFMTNDTKKIYINLMLGRVPFEKAASEYIDYLEMLNNDGHERTDGYLSVVNNLAYCYNNIGKYNKAIDLIKSTLDKNPGVYTETRLMFSEFNLGESYYSLGDYESALRHFKNSRAYSMSTFSGVDYYKSYANCKIGVVLLRLGKADKARPLIEEALNHHRSLEHSSLLSEIEEMYKDLQRTTVNQDI
jgi:serine/threonine protein kinase